MANSTSSGSKAKADENNNGRRVGEISPINSGSSMKDATGPRRSMRETSSKKASPSPSSTRKSERLGKSSSLSPLVRRKSQRVEKQNMPSPLRRSKRNQSDVSPLSSKSVDSSVLKKKKKKKHKSVKKLTFEAEKAENKDRDGETSQVKRKRLDARAYVGLIKKKPKIGCPEETNGKDKLIQKGRNIVEEKTDEHFEENNLDCKEVANDERLPSDDAKEPINSAAEDRDDTEATFAAETSGKGVDCSPSNDVSTEIQADDGKICLICKCGGRLIFCDGKECDGCYHFSCLEPPLVDAPLGVWHCDLCVKKKIELGVYSVSEGIESIWDAREVQVSHANGWTTEKHFLVKYKGLAHVHNRWVSKNQLLLEAPPVLLEKFNQGNQALKWRPEWSLPHRLLQKRALNFAQQDGDARSGQAVGNSDCHHEWLVKWHGLGYEHATWELDNAPFLRSLEGRRLIKDYEDYHQRAKGVPLSSKVDKKLDRISSFSKLSQTPGGFPPGFGINNLDAINKLREHWHKSQNAVVFDDHDRMVKMVAFILSLDSNACRPFLIISTSAALHLWEDEFSCWAPSLNVIIYSGNKEIRGSIRKLEFYGEGGCLLFQVLIVLPEIIIEDLEVLEGIEFEAIIVDECQCSEILSHLKQIKVLKTDLWILLFSGQLKDSVVQYHDILAFLSDERYNEDSDDLISYSSDIGQLKDKLSSFVAYRCKSDSFRFVEYWVPVNLSNAQLEQYCAALLSNSSILRSQSKSHVVGALHDVLITTRKCCNHPYLVDESLQSLLIKDIPPAEILDVGIKASGKLQLLDSMLMELKKQGLRVLILFQFLGGSGKVSIGDILDDLIRQRFGPDSYERIDKCVLNAKKQGALKMFNNKDHGRFVFLLEANACHHNIKLSSVDTIIIFDSDWNPLNDIRSLQKITLDSQLEQIKIFRLYSSFTVEERALVLAKQDRPLDSKLDISWSTIHTLLMWGAWCLFDDLKAFHDAKTDILSLNSLSGQSSLKQTLHEFSSILKQNGEDNDARDCSFLLKVKQNGLRYHPNFSLLGEWIFKSLESEPCHLFWTKVLEGKYPRWKYSSGSSQRSRKRVHLFDGSGNRPDLESEEVVKKHARLINNADQPYSKRDGEILSAGNKEERPQGNDVEFLKARKLHDEQRSVHLSLKSEIPKLCEILHVPDNVKRMADEFLEYVMNNHHVNSALPKSVLEAFQISLCWIAAALVKHKIDHEASLMLAKQHLKFDCRKDEANVIYSMLQCLKSIFLHRTGIYNVTGSPKASAAELSVKNYSSTGLALEVELAKKDILKSIRKIQKKFQKKLRKLHLKHQEEKSKLDATYEEKKAYLEKEYKIESAVLRFVSSNDVMRSVNLKDLDIKYTGRIEDLKHQHEIHLKDLENVQLIARQMLQNTEATWVEDVKSWAQDELLNRFQSKEHGNGIGYLKTSEQAEPDNDPKNRCLASNLVTKSTNADRRVEAMTGTGVGSSRTPEIGSSVAVQCSNPVEGQTPPVEASSAYEGYDRAQNAGDSQGKMISVHSHSNEQNVNGATCMVNEGEGYDISNDGCREKNVPDGSEKDITVDPPSRKLISNGSSLNISDRELSSRQGENPILPDQPTSDVVSLFTQDGQVPIEVPETSRGMAECYNGREPQTDVLLLDQNARSEEQEQMLRTMNDNTLFQALQDSHASLLTSPRQVDKDATVEEIQNSSGPVVQVSSPVAVIPADRSNLEPVREPVDVVPDDQSNFEPVEQVQQLPSAEALASNQDTAGEMQISTQQVEALSSPVDALPAGQFNHDSVMEPSEQLQQLPSTEPASNRDTTNSGELLNSSQQVNVAQANGLNHEFGELLQQMQQLPPVESPNSTLDPSSASEIEPRSNNEDSVSGHVPPAPMEVVTNPDVVHPVSNSELDSHTPVGAFRTQSLDTRNMFTPLEINNHLRQTSTQSMNRRHSPLDNDPLKNELDRLRKVSEQTMKYYEDVKLRLKSDCEREIEEIRKKYDIKLQESELEFQLKKKNLDASLNLVQMNKMWAEAFRSKCMDLRASGVPGMNQDPSFTQQLFWYSRQQRDVRPPLVASPPHGPPTSTMPHFATATSSQTMVPPPVSSMPTFSHQASSQILATPMPAMASSSPMVAVPPIYNTTSSQAMAPPPRASYSHPLAPHITSISPLANHQAGSGFRTTPPHLRPSAALPDPCLSTPARVVPSQQALNNTLAMPSLPMHPRPTLSNIISDPHYRLHLASSSREPAMDGNCQLGTNLPNTLLRSSSATPLQQPEFGVARSTHDDSPHQATPSDVVCLSDDD